jgi:hypothetical protein
MHILNIDEDKTTELIFDNELDYRVAQELRNDIMLCSQLHHKKPNEVRFEEVYDMLPTNIKKYLSGYYSTLKNRRFNKIIKERKNDKIVVTKIVLY